MASPIFYRFPQSLVAGDTARIQLTFGDFPSNLWAASLKINKVGSPALSVSGSATSNGFLFVVQDTLTENLAPGNYTWGVRVTEAASGDSRTADGGSFVLLANYAGIIQKSTAQLQLDAANTAFATVVANPESSVSFNGQNFTTANSYQLLDIISRLEAKVKAELAEASGFAGDPPTRSIRPFFV